MQKSSMLDYIVKNSLVNTKTKQKYTKGKKVI